MKCLTLPYGNTGWNGKISILEEIISVRPGPPFLYNDVLIVVPSSRMKRIYGRLFLDALQRLHGAASLVQPHIQTLYQLFQKFYNRLSAPLLIDENSRLVLLEGIVKERLGGRPLFNQSPDLLAPSLSSTLAKMIEQLSAAGVSPDDLTLKIKETELFDKPQVHMLADVYARYENALHESNLTDPAGMRAYVRDHFDRAWLADYRTIIIDGIQDMGKLEADILRKAGECGNCVYLVDAPSPKLLKRAGEFHPLKIVKDSLGQIGVLPEEEYVGADTEQLLLASALFSDDTFFGAAKKAPNPASFTKKMALLSAVNTREEVTLIAEKVKKSLKCGTLADSILVAFPSLDEYGPIVEEIFTDYGIPYNRALGRQLGTSAVASAIVSLLHACQEDFSAPSLLRVFSSPFLKFSGNPAIAPALDRFMRDKHITGGKQKLLASLKFYEPGTTDPDVLREPLNDLFAALEPFSLQDNLHLGIWMMRLSNLMAWSGLGARVSLIKGPLNINLQAYKKLNEMLNSLAQAGELFPGYRHTFSEWLFLVKRTFMHARFQVPPEDEGGVQILGLDESLSHPWKEIYLGGLVDGKFPQRLPQNIFLPEQTLETMGVRTLERARLNAAYHFYRLLLSADNVTLTYPENEGDRPVVPSPFLEELTPLRKAGLLNRGVERTSGIQFSLKIEECRSMPELAKSISLAEDFTGLDDILSLNIEGVSGIKSAIGHKPAEQMSSITPHIKREFWVTELDAYLNCPYDYLITNVMGLEPLEEVTEDISPLDRGSKVHSILRNFYFFWKKTVTRDSRDAAKELLRKLADSAFDSDANTFRNRHDKELFLMVMAERFLDAEEVFWKQGMKPAYLEQKIDHYRLVLSTGEEVELSAKIDRIDVDGNGNFIIVDYKTGRYPLPRMQVDQEIFQLPVYAVMAAAIKNSTPELKRPIGLAYYDLAGKTEAGVRDVVLFNNETRNDHPSSKPKASSKSAEEFETILHRSMDRARKAIEGILAGDFTTKPRDENRCRYCPLEMMCEKEETE
jgi:ATP-dependent helicase/DNAse subunit B